MQNNSYETSPVKRKRATKAVMIERTNFVTDFTREFAPVTVRQVFYAATVNNIIEKTEDGYSKIQQACLFGRRNGTIPYWQIADKSRSYLYEVLANKSQGMKASAIIGFRSLFEHFFNITGTSSARDRFVSTCSKERDGTTKTKNNFLYKLMWLQENGLLSRLQKDAIENMMRQGNVAVHRMESTDVNLNKAVEILYHLTVSYRMFDANQTK